MPPQKHSRKSGLPPVAACLAVLTVASQHASAQFEYSPDWARNFRVGLLTGFNIKANFKTTAAAFGISGHPTGVYDDGYVLTDATGNAGGWTSNWGYKDASQYDGNHTIEMHSAYTFNANSGNFSGGESDAPYLGLDLAYGGVVWRRNYLRIGWEFGFGWLPVKISGNESFDGTANRHVYTFDTGGAHVPSAPYNGTGDLGNGALIRYNRQQQPDDTIGAGVTGTRSLDATLYSFRLGPTLYWDLTPRIGLQAGAGPALGIVSGSLRYDETLTFADGGTTRNSGKVSSTDITYGGYVNAMLTFHTVKNGDFYIGAQYMPMGKAHIGGGGRQAELDLKGQVYVSAGINWPF